MGIAKFRRIKRDGPDDRKRRITAKAIALTRGDFDLEKTYQEQLKDWFQKEKDEHGLVDVKLCLDPEKPANADKICEDFLKIQEAVAEGRCVDLKDHSPNL